MYAEKFAIFHGWSDSEAFEIVKQVSERTLEVRELKATLLNPIGSSEPDALQFSPGGFSGHTSGVQRYSFESDPTATVRRIRLGKKGWKDASGGRFTLATEPHKHYDYNF